MSQRPRLKIFEPVARGFQYRLSFRAASASLVGNPTQWVDAGCLVSYSEQEKPYQSLSQWILPCSKNQYKQFREWLYSPVPT
jgi:hypothetical protein